MPDQSTPEIDRLREGRVELIADQRKPALRGPTRFVPLADAIQAVRDTEARVREERAVDFRPVSIESARREAFREAVEALREEYDIDSPLDWDDAARFIESRFLSHPDNPEDNA